MDEDVAPNEYADEEEVAYEDTPEGKVEKARMELTLAEKGLDLEKARKTMHEGDERTPEQIAAFKELSNEYQGLREAFREKFPPKGVVGGDEEGTDAVAAPASVEVPMKVQEGA